MALTAALFAGCGSSGDTGGDTGGGGSGGGTTSTGLPACPDSSPEVHVRATIVKPDGQSVAFDNLALTGTVVAVGVATPPSSACGADDAWVTFDATDGSGQWLACFLMPDFTFTLAAGGAVELSYSSKDNDIDPSSHHTTLRSNGQLVIHVENVSFKHDMALPGNLSVIEGDALCESPTDIGCGVRISELSVSLGDASMPVTPDESVVIGGYRVLVDTFHAHLHEGGCDSGDAAILIGIVPSP